MQFRKAITRQFSKPRGWLGAVAGVIMAHRPSNRRRYAWTMACLKIVPDDRVLEIGCGPGLGLSTIVPHLDSGKIVGIDHSPVMIRQATLRNRMALRTGKAVLAKRGMYDLPAIEGGYTKVMAINVLQYAHDVNVAAKAIIGVMAPGGLLAATYQPRTRPTREAAIAFGDRLAIAFGHAGFIDIRMKEMPEGVGPVITVLAVKPDK